MPIRRTYRPGSFLRVDDRTGFTYYAEQTKKQWDNLIVRDKSWEERQPQDFVKGTSDPQTVPEPRPLQPAVFLTSQSFYLVGNALPTFIYGHPVLDSMGDFVLDSQGNDVLDIEGISVVFDSIGNPVLDSMGLIVLDSGGICNVPSFIVNSSVGWLDGDTIWIMRNTGDYWIASVIAISGQEIVYYPSLPETASSGNVVLNNSLSERS